MDKIDILKKSLGLAISIGTSSIVGEVIKRTTSNDISKGAKLTRSIAGWAISGCIASNVTKYVENEIDDYKKALDDMLDEMRENVRKEAEDGGAEGTDD